MQIFCSYRIGEFAPSAQHAPSGASAPPNIDSVTISTSALHDVAMTGRVRRLHYEHAEGLSLQQAQRDLRDLVATQVLAPVGRTRARYYTEGPRFPEEALSAARTPTTLMNPYGG
jgi:hypothetical protein